MSNVRNRRRGEGQRNMVAALIRLGTGRAGLLGLRPAPQRRTGLGLHNVAVPTERSCLRANALQEGFLCHSRRRRRTIADARFQFLSVLDRKSVVSGKSVSVRVDLGGRRSFNKKINTKIKQSN